MKVNRGNGFDAIERFCNRKNVEAIMEDRGVSAETAQRLLDTASSLEEEDDA